MHLAEDDHIFVLLYKEMWFRHLYAKGRPTLAQAELGSAGHEDGPMTER